MARYIDADKLINEFGNCTLATWGKGLGASWWSQSVKLKDNMVECINKQPTADVEEVKHGEWKKISVASEHGYGQVYYQHSSCEVNSTELFQCPYERCPRCGAKMNVTDTNVGKIGGNAE